MRGWSLVLDDYRLCAGGYLLVRCWHNAGLGTLQDTLFSTIQMRIEDQDSADHQAAAGSFQGPSRGVRARYAECCWQL